MKKFSGFTLAEVLITLTIIGVISVLTVPSLIANINNQTNMVKLRKGYATVNQVIGMQMAEDGTDTTDAPQVTKPKVNGGNVQMSQGIMSIIAKNVQGRAIDANTWKSNDGVTYYFDGNFTANCTTQGATDLVTCGNLYIITKMPGETATNVSAAIASGKLITVDGTTKEIQPGQSFKLPFYRDGIGFISTNDKSSDYEAAYRVINNLVGVTTSAAN